jgi:hypothetical protein
MAADLIAGDRGSKLVVTCKDSETGAVLDLTSKTIQLRYQINGGTLVTKTMTAQSPAASGNAEYQFAAADLVAGTMVLEVRLQNGLADQLTSVDKSRLTVGAPLA